MEYIREILGKNLAILRKGRRLTQQEVADAIGVSQPTYGRWEGGKQWIEDPQSLERLAEFYGVRSTYFFHDPELNSPNIDKTKLKEKLLEAIKLLD